MSNLKLEQDQANRLATLIDGAHSDAKAIVGRIAGGFDIIGTAAFSGLTANATAGKQDEFNQHWAKMGQILDDLKDGVLKAAGLLGDQDHSGGQTVQAIAPEGSGSGMSAKFPNRLSA